MTSIQNQSKSDMLYHSTDVRTTQSE